MLNRILASIMAFIVSMLNLVGIAEKHTDDFRVTTYLVASNVKSEDSLHSEDFDIITDVILFSLATFDAKGQVHEDGRLPFVLDTVRKVVGDRDVKLHINLLGPGPLVSHGDWYEDMDDQGEQHNLAFKSGVLEDNIVNLINKYDFDGAYFDYEYPHDTKDWLTFSKFLISLDKKLGDKILGCAISTDVALSPTAVRKVDRFETMIYDIYDDEGRHAPTEISEQIAYQFIAKGIPMSKMDFGLPFYARPIDHDAYWYGYNGCAGEMDENGYYTDKNINKTFWFNTPDVIAEKTTFAINNSFGGVMIWHYSCDFASSNEKSLLKAVGDSITNAQNSGNSFVPPC